jgi:hypothetical protein
LIKEDKMKNIRTLRRILTVLISSSILISQLCFAIVFAAPTANISISGNKEVGSEITAVVTISGDGPYGNFDGYFSYDSIFQLVKITPGNFTANVFSNNGNNFSDYGLNVPSGLTIVATFKCIKAGTGTISCKFDDVGNPDGTSLGEPSDSESITITTPVPKSTNANLSSLQISPGTLSPAFSASTQSYSATVAQDQTTITVSAVAADSKAKVKYNDVKNNLVVGTNSVKITVTAENGSTKVYTITVTRTSGPTPTPTPTSPPLPLMTYDGTEYTIMPIGLDIVMPDGFVAGFTTYQDVQIPVIQKVLGAALDAQTLSLVLLGNDTGNKYFVYDQISQTIYPYQLIATSLLSFLVLGESVTSEAPVGYEGFDYVFMDTTIHAYRLISDPENKQIILYMMDDAGVQGFYYYDTLTGMILPYRGEAVLISVDPSSPVSTTPVPTVTNPSGMGNAADVKEGSLTFDSLRDYRNPVVLVIYLISAFCLILLIVLIVMILRKSFPYQQDMFSEDVDYSDQDTPNVRVYNPPEQSVFYNEFVPPQADKPIVYVEDPVAEKTMPVFDFPVITRIPADQKTRTVSSTDHVPVRLQMEMYEKASLKSRDDAADKAEKDVPSDDTLPDE